MEFMGDPAAVKLPENTMDTGKDRRKQNREVGTKELPIFSFELLN